MNVTGVAESRAPPEGLSPIEGYAGHSDWRDMSEYVVHFTKASHVTAVENLLAILSESQLNPGQAASGAGRGLDALGETQRCVCMSEIPLDLLERLVRRRSTYGVGFRKGFIVARGGDRVWYLDREGLAASAFEELKRSHLDSFDAQDPLWKLTPFVDLIGEYGETVYRFEWEREWRVAGEIRFAFEDLAFIFVPEGDHPRVVTFFDERGGPGPPLIDPVWPMEQIQEALASLPAGDPLDEGWEDPDQCPYAMSDFDFCPVCGHSHGQHCHLCGSFHG